MTCTKQISMTGYWDCMALTVDKSQEGFVADNKQSLVEAAYEDGLYTLGIYHEETMVGFVLYDYDDTFLGWAMSRFMIGKQFQGKGFGKQAALAFLDYFKNKHNADKLYISVSYLTSCPIGIADRNCKDNIEILRFCVNKALLSFPLTKHNYRYIM